MRTTINSVGRRGGAYSAEQIEELEAVLLKTRRLLADTQAVLDLKFDKLTDEQIEAEGSDVTDINKSLVEVRKTMLMVLDLEAKLCISSLSAAPLDMEAARHEIFGRLARLS